MTPTRVYVVREAVAAAIAQPERGLTCLVVRHPDGRSSYTNDVRIPGPSRVVFDPKGLPDGAHAWIETESPVEVIPPESPQPPRAGGHP